MARQIVDPAERLNKEFAEVLEKRYAGFFGIAEIPDFEERYANVCDLVVQLLWPEAYGADPVDPAMHTSTQAREIARLFFAVAGIEPESP